jgi:hypothetical protein
MTESGNKKGCRSPQWAALVSAKLLPKSIVIGVGSPLTLRRVLIRGFGFSFLCTSCRLWMRSPRPNGYERDPFRNLSLS